jgi:C-terminal processing protease CtpA/Prc
MNTFLTRLSLGMFSLLVAASVCIAQEQKTDETKDLKDDQQQTKQQQENKENREARQETREKARDAAQDQREKTGEAREENRDATQEQREKARAAREEAREKNQEQRQDTRTDRRDNRETTRDDRRDTREGNRDSRQATREEGGQRVRSFFRGRSAEDLGIRFEGGQADRLTVMELDRDSLGAQIGLRQGDIIMSINGRGVRSNDDFNRGMGANLNNPASLMIQRNGRQYTLQMQPRSDEQNRYSYEPGNNGGRRAYLGVTFDPSYREFAVVREVKEGSPAEKIGLKPGDTLTHINGQEVSSLQHCLRALSMMAAGQEFELQYDRPKHETVKLSLAEREQHSPEATFDNSNQNRDDRKDREENQQD